jgi:hypothetical protein
MRPDRQLTSSERALIDRLLEPEFPGRDELRLQLNTAHAVDLDNGGLALTCDAAGRAPVKVRVPTEGEYVDRDGITVHVLLHVVDGLLRELEIYKDDSSVVLDAPTPSGLDVVAPFGR